MVITNKTIWTMWYQGYEAAPGLVKLCLESWQQFNPDWKVVALDQHSIHEFLDLSAIVDIKRRDITIQKISNIIRLNLLVKFGGVWADATVFCRKPLDLWLADYFSAKFFTFRNPGPDRLISSWFIAAEPDNIILQNFHRDVMSYWNNNFFSNQNNRMGRFFVDKFSPHFNNDPRKTIFWLSFFARKILRAYPYFILHYTFNKMIFNDAACRELWQNARTFDAALPHRLLFLQYQKDTKTALAEIDEGLSPVYKLDWRVDPAEPYWNSVLTRLSSVSGRHTQ